MKIYIIAGEASGDLHGSNLIKALLQKQPNAEIRFWGGNLMQKAGGTLVKHYKDLAFMGFAEVLMNIRTILKNISFCKQDILNFNPDKIVFIDYPGFNLRIAKWCKQQKIETNYYISPQIWAWKESRIKDIKRDIDKLFVILPFEKPFYEDKHNFKVHFVGHPLLDEINDRNQINLENFKKEYLLDNRPKIALLPGSRKQEINTMLSTMVKMVDEFKDYQFIIAGAPSQSLEHYKPYLSNNVKFIDNKTYDVLSISSAALVTSGTATLETALFKVPQVVCYKGNSISYAIAKRIIKLKYISLVNLILDKECVTELIQSEFNAKRLAKELALILDDETRKTMFLDYFELEKKLGFSGASTKTAELILS